MDLKSGCIFWLQAGASAISAPPLDEDLTCQVAIIGGGITGAMCAYELTRAGIDAVLLDRREFGHGSTAASTGLLQYEIDTPLTKLRTLVPPAHADRAYTLCVNTVKSFQALVAELDDSSDLVARRSLYLAKRPADAQELRAELEARRSIGIEVEYLDSRNLARDYGINRPAALLSTTAMEVDPYRLALALLRKSLSRGLRVYARTPISKYDTTDDGVILRAAHGPVVQAGRVIFATGYETPKFFPRDICKLKSTFALVGAPTDLSAWRARPLIWEHASPYFYARTTSDDRAMIGGEDEDFDNPAKRDALIPDKSRALVSKFARLFPRIELRAHCAWAGTFAQTRDGLPYIGPAREFPNAFFALGYGGNGIVFGLIAARLICDLLLGRPNSDSRIFSFDRSV